MLNEPRIEIISTKKLIGKKIRMSLAADRTHELWKSLMQQRDQIKNRISTELVSMRVYDDSSYFSNFNMGNSFDKWAAAEVSNVETIPEGMESIIIPEGLYAVFLYKGAASAAGTFFQNIFSNWLPASDYILDNRPHFEVLGTKYKNEHPDSEEEVFIPVRKKL